MAACKWAYTVGLNHSCAALKIGCVLWRPHQNLELVGIHRTTTLDMRGMRAAWFAPRARAISGSAKYSHICCNFVPMGCRFARIRWTSTRFGSGISSRAVEKCPLADIRLAFRSRAHSLQSKVVTTTRISKAAHTLPRNFNPIICCRKRHFLVLLPWSSLCEQTLFSRADLRRIHVFKTPWARPLLRPRAARSCRTVNTARRTRLRV